MKIFLDTADTQLIEKHFATGLIDGITTNPSLILKSGKQPEDVYRQLANLGIPDISFVPRFASKLCAHNELLLLE